MDGEEVKEEEVAAVAVGVGVGFLSAMLDDSWCS